VKRKKSKFRLKIELVSKMRSLLSGIFKENIFLALRARRLLKTPRASSEGS